MCHGSPMGGGRLVLILCFFTSWSLSMTSRLGHQLERQSDDLMHAAPYATEEGATTARVAISNKPCEKLPLPPGRPYRSFNFTPSSMPLSELSDISLHVVYFANLYQYKWRGLVTLQLKELSDWGISNFARSVTVVLTKDQTPPMLRSMKIFTKLTEVTSDELIAMVRSIIPKAVVQVYRRNEYEYRGIRAMWDVGQRIPKNEAHRHVVLYFHSKGMVTPVPWEQDLIRTQWNLQLSLVVLKPWKSILKAMIAVPSIDKAGIYTAYPGWVWFNFMYVRASALQKLPPPILGVRHLYEAYVSGHINSSVFAPFPSATRYSFPCDPNLFNCLSLCPKWSFRDHMPLRSDEPQWPLCYPGPGFGSFRVPARFEGPQWEETELSDLLKWVTDCRNERLELCKGKDEPCPRLLNHSEGICGKDVRATVRDVLLSDFSS